MKRGKILILILGIVLLVGVGSVDWADVRIVIASI